MHGFCFTIPFTIDTDLWWVSFLHRCGFAYLTFDGDFIGQDVFFPIFFLMVVDLLHSKSISMIFNNIKLQQVARIKLLLNWIVSKSLAFNLFYCSQIHCTIAEISPFLFRCKIDLVFSVNICDVHSIRIVVCSFFLREQNRHLNH